MKPIFHCFAIAGLFALAALPAQAQAARYQVHSIDFGIWCTEIERLPWQRCEQRLADDVAKFEVYRHTFERYEIQRLRDSEYVLRFDETFLHNDPVDRRPDDTLPRPPSALSGR
jgi:hypothetical protein